MGGFLNTSPSPLTPSRSKKGFLNTPTKCATCGNDFSGPGEVCPSCRDSRCQVCGKAIAAGLERLCAVHRYGQSVEHHGEHVRDSVDLMRMGDSIFLASPSSTDLRGICHTCGLSAKPCACHLDL